MSKHIKYLPLVLLIAVTLKGLITHFNYVDAPMLCILAGLAAFYEAQVHSKKYKEMQEEQAKTLRRLDEINQTFDSLKGAIASLKITSSYNKTSNIR